MTPRRTGNCMSAHGHERATLEHAIAADLKPQKKEDTLAFTRSMSCTASGWSASSCSALVWGSEE
ncbi:MAG: homogentisate 1,2-dioxygenase [Candidatus Eremiobacteraeota bacterium]|nr:homogentisate 1,2-dioxygenase [Candidatus Eremiobacteraeota bacterium]